MGETTKKAKPVGRILGYERTNYEEKIQSFKTRIKEQIDVVRIGIKNGDVNDPKIAEKFAKKAEKFINIPYFFMPNTRNNRVSQLKEHLKVEVGFRKAVIKIVKDWLSLKKSYKILTAADFSSGSEKKFHYYEEMAKFYAQDVEFLYGIKPEYKSELILVNKLIGLVSDDEFMKRLGAKNSWKVETLKANLSEWAEDFPLGVAIELDDIFKLPYFKGKKCLDLTLVDFKALIKVRAKILEKIIDWIDSAIKPIDESKRILEEKKDQFSYYNITYLYDAYDKFFTGKNAFLKMMEDEYSLYRFGQGLIEADVFDSVYK